MKKHISKLKLRDPTLLNVGSVKKSDVSGKYYKVSKTHKWVPASKNEVLCDRYLKQKIKSNIKEYKSGKNPRIRSVGQAIAVSYSQTRKAKPRCRKVSNQ